MMGVAGSGRMSPLSWKRRGLLGTGWRREARSVVSPTSMGAWSSGR